MKTTLLTPSLWLGFAAFAAGASAQTAAPAPVPAPDKAPAPDTRAVPGPRPAAKPGELRFNFRGAPLETVLNYMSDAAGFIIVLETPVRGTVDMWSSQAVTREEAVQLLNQALNKNGYSASVQGRSLIVSSKDDAKKKNIPIRTGNDPQEIPMNAELVMQIIPLRRIDATQAARDLATLIPGSATLTANQDSNSLVVTDTNINVRHIVEIVSALDTSADTVSTMKMFKLTNADPVEMAQLITNIFSTPGQGQSATAGRGGAGGFPGGFPGVPGFGGRGGTTGGGATGRTSRTGTTGGGASSSSRSTPVVAIADARTYSVIVTAGKDAMPEISDIIAQLDASPARKQKVFVYTLENADVKQVESVLKNLFQSSNARASTSTQTDPLATRAANNSQTTSSNTTLSTSGRR
jgi:type II secretory pathway component GspD/PulD (secretin)